MASDRVGEGVLGIGVNVHLDNAVAQSLLNLLLLGARATMEDEIERLGTVLKTKLLHGNLLALIQNLRAQLHVARLVNAVDVTEGSGQQVAAFLTGAEGIDGLLEILRGGVEVSAGLSLNAVLFAADNTNLNLENDIGVLCLLQQLLGDFQVLIDRDSGAVPHVGLEQRQLAAVYALLGEGDERAHVLIQNFLLAVVGVQRNVDAVVLCCFVREGSECLCTGNLVLHGQAGTELGTAGGELDDAVGLSLGEAAECCVDGFGGGAVDGRECEAALLGGIEHLVIDLRGCDWHKDPSFGVAVQ